jgi:hypothetical protein
MGFLNHGDVINTISNSKGAFAVRPFSHELNHLRLLVRRRAVQDHSLAFEEESSQWLEEFISTHKDFYSTAGNQQLALFHRL